MRESRLSGSVEGVMSDHDSYSDYFRAGSASRTQYSCLVGRYRLSLTLTLRAGSWRIPPWWRRSQRERRARSAHDLDSGLMPIAWRPVIGSSLSGWCASSTLIVEKAVSNAETLPKDERAPATVRGRYICR